MQDQVRSISITFMRFLLLMINLRDSYSEFDRLFWKVNISRLRVASCLCEIVELSSMLG